jgi:hypothetical protein
MVSRQQRNIGIILNRYRIPKPAKEARFPKYDEIDVLQIVMNQMTLMLPDYRPDIRHNI